MRFISQLTLVAALLSSAVFANATIASAASEEFAICITKSVRGDLPKKLAKRSDALPEKTVYRIDETMGNKLFEGVRQDWLDYIDSDGFKSLLKKFADGKVSKIKDKEVSQVVGVRLKGLSLVEAFKLFDDDHAFPPDLRRFVKQLGYLKDYLKNRDDLSKKEIQALQDQARKVLKKLKKVPTSPDDITINPASAASNTSFVQSTLDEVQAISSEDVVKAPEYHRVRKDLRRLKVMFGLIADYNNDPTAKLVEQYLGKVTSQMEEVHDKLVAQKITGQIDYENADVVFPQDLREKLQHFRAMVQ